MVFLIMVYVFLSRSGLLAFIETGDMNRWIRDFGVYGPFVIIGMMMVAIVMSPIPSAPIALAAGAAYGHTEGTLYVLIGSELGAILAFYIARLVGAETLQRCLGRNISDETGHGASGGWLGSQNTLMGIVFVSRLLPFVSFDIVSYAAGLSRLTFWRFAVATLAGVLPASFLLAHFGSELVSGESDRIGMTLVLLLGIPAIIFLIKWVVGIKNKKE